MSKPRDSQYITYRYLKPGPNRCRHCDRSFHAWKIRAGVERCPMCGRKR